MIGLVGEVGEWNIHWSGVSGCIAFDSSGMRVLGMVMLRVPRLVFGAPR